jgi:serine/threonine protein kinase
MLVCPRCRSTFDEGTPRCPTDGLALLPEATLALTGSPLTPGTMVGEYRVEEELGAGSFGAVYGGVQPLIGKRVAIKVLHAALARDPEAVSRFVAEARAVNTIHHPHIVDIFSFGALPDGRPYLVMERLEGLSLAALIEREGPLSIGLSLALLEGIAEALDAVHEAAITHRDLKPDNVFLVRGRDGSWTPKLLDFGVAKLMAEELAHKTATGAAIGTPRYMSPEQTRGKPVDARADVYALGVVAHELLTGAPLFEGDSVMDVLFKHAAEPPPRMSSVASHLPPELDEPVLAMLAKRPSARPAKAGVAIAALRARARALGLDAQGDRASLEPPTSGSAPTRRVAHERPAAARTVAVEAISAAPELAASAAEQLGADAERAGERAHAPSETSETSDTSETSETSGPSGSSGPSGPSGPNPQRRLRPWMLVALVGPSLVALALATYLRARAPGGDGRSASPPSSASTSALVTLRLAVTPLDAHVFVDGAHAGPASAPLVLPRSTEQRVIRVERAGYEALTLWIVPERDRDLPPITLTLASLSSAPVGPASALASSPAFIAPASPSAEGALRQPSPSPKGTAGPSAARPRPHSSDLDRPTTLDDP